MTHPPAARLSAALFDGQATRFDGRTGLGEEASRAIAERAIALGAVEPGERVLEIGAGTGQIGRHLAAHPVRYLGLDVSAGMLAVHRGRLASPRAWLLGADADRRWPVADGSVRLCFGSRALHLLSPGHLADELLRTASPRGATLVVGRVRREPESVRRRMAEEMRRRLRQHGFASRGGGEGRRALADACAARGAAPLPTVEAARWRVTATPRASLESWRSLVGLGGAIVPAEIKQQILSTLADWAEQTLGGLDRRHESEETYELEGMRLPPRAA